MDSSTVKTEILRATIVLFNENGLKFTMDELAARLHKSKKTIYAIFPDKHALLNEMVDYIFNSIKETEHAAATDPDSSTLDRLRGVLGAMPQQFLNVDFRRLYVLKDRYPDIYDHVQTRLEDGWDETVSLLKQGMQEGVIRRVSIPVFKMMFQASVEQFFQRDILVAGGITYNQGLQEVVRIMIDGVRVS